MTRAGVRAVAWRGLALLVAASVSTAAPAAAPGGDGLAPCRIAGVAHELRCGRIAQPLDPSAPGGRRIEIHYAVAPALSRRKLADPVVFLAGGPGQSAIDVAPQVLPLLARLNQRRDIVFVDQRGTGRSAPLACPAPPREPLGDADDPALQAAQLRRCLDALLALPHVASADDLRFFTTWIASRDLDAVRQRLGADRLNLVGVSYGTRAALDYLRQFPTRVRRSVLDGVAPPDMALPATASADAQAALDALLDACAREPACAAAHPDLRARWQALLASLPREVSVPDPLTGRRETLRLTRTRLLGAVRAPLYVPAVAAALPHAIDEAARGRFDALAGLTSVFAPRHGEALAMGLHFAVVCAEDAPLVAAQGEPSGADFGAEFARLYERACAGWPRGEVPASFVEMPPAASPVLLLSGGADPATPPRHAERVLRALGARARHVVVPQAGHGVLALGCLPDVLLRFVLATDDAEALASNGDCVTTAQAVPRPPAYRAPVPSVRAAQESAR